SAQTSVAPVSTLQGPVAGLDCGVRLEARLPAPTHAVELTLSTRATAPLVSAFNEDGSLAGTATLPGAPRAVGTVRLTGPAISRVEITAEANEAALHRLCWQDARAVSQPAPPIDVVALAGSVPVATAQAQGASGQEVMVSLEADLIA